MKAVLIMVIAVVLVSATAVIVLIGSSYRAASEAIRDSSSSNCPDLLRRAVLAAETSHQRSAADISMQLAKDYTFRYNQPSRNIIFQIRELLLSTAISARYSPN